MTVFSSTFGGREAAVILEAEIADDGPPRRPAARLRQVPLPARVVRPRCRRCCSAQQLGVDRCRGRFPPVCAQARCSRKLPDQSGLRGQPGWVDGARRARCRRRGGPPCGGADHAGSSAANPARRADGAGGVAGHARHILARLGLGRCPRIASGSGYDGVERGRPPGRVTQRRRAAGPRLARSRGFGRFRLRRREPRRGRNPRIGDRVDVPSKHVAYFKPGKELDGTDQRRACPDHAAAGVQVGPRRTTLPPRPWPTFPERLQPRRRAE